MCNNWYSIVILFYCYFDIKEKYLRRLERLKYFKDNISVLIYQFFYKLCQIKDSFTSSVFTIYLDELTICMNSRFSVLVLISNKNKFSEWYIKIFRNQLQSAAIWLSKTTAERRNI